MTEIITVQGLQWGSEAKGSIASMIAHGWEPDTVVSAWHPNAGHTCWIDGKKYVHSMLPIGALAPSVQKILLGPGSVIDYKKLTYEMAFAGDLLKGKEVIIHPNASVLTEQDLIDERVLVKIGSTMKGSAAAVIRKMRRIDEFATAGQCGERMLPGAVIRRDLYDVAIEEAGRMLVEGAQGFGLGFHMQFYPYTTSRDVSTAQLLADCRIPYQPVLTVGVCRTFPIRVANRFNDRGEMIGTSGSCYTHQREMDWAELGREAELTTVTKLPRRIFTFDMDQIWDAVRIMRPDIIALTFCDYLLNDDHNFTRSGDRGNMPNPVRMLINEIEHGCSVPVRFCTFGPEPRDIWQVHDSTLWPLVRPFEEDPFHG